MDKKLAITFHGRVIEHLGIEMYHSPVAALAELVSNAWDAEANAVDIRLPTSIRSDAVIEVSDDGDGMTFDECQGRFLKVGYNRRKKNGVDTTRTGRPVMGRKGIGKFAGFGIAEVLEIATVSHASGERTVFRLDVKDLLGDAAADTYVDESPMDVEVLDYAPPDAERARKEHGTKVTLRQLTIVRTPNPASFAQSMARRFMLLERAAGFEVTINAQKYDVQGDAAKIEFDFPASYGTDQIPSGIEIEDGWAREKVGGHSIRWRISFYKDPIDEEDLTGVAVFSHGKLAQRPFLFQLRGGLGGQQGLAYVTGSVVADFIDEQETDLISTERQRINWENESAGPLLDWGQERLKQLLRIWQTKRSESKVAAIENRVAGFSSRLAKLGNPEQKVLKRALYAIARITVISQDQFDDLADAILTAWEGGRLHDLIRDMADADDLDSDQLVRLLAESRVMTALHAAERVKSQLNLILSLEERITRKDLENAVRDYLAENPWMIFPKWETFKVETGVNHLVVEAASEAGANQG